MASLINKNFSISNDIIVARHGLDIAEWFLISIVLAKLDQRKEVRAGTEFTLYIEDFCEARDISMDWAVKQLRAASLSLLSKTYEQYENGWAGTTNFVVSSFYEEATGTVKIIFTEPFMQKLFALENKFTTLKMKELSKFNNNYAWRLFSILKGYRYRGNEGSYTVDWKILNDMFCSDCKEYKRFKEYILIPAIKTIEKETNMEVKLVERRNRKVSNITFIYKFIAKD